MSHVSKNIFFSTRADISRVIFIYTWDTLYNLWAYEYVGLTSNYVLRAMADGLSASFLAECSEIEKRLYLCGRIAQDRGLGS